MTEEKIIIAIDKVKSYSGMTVNEMLFAAGLSQVFYDSLSSDKIEAEIILRHLKLDQNTIVETLSQNPSKLEISKRFNRYKKYSIGICLLFTFGLILGRIGESYFRFSNLRFIYHFCWISNYLFIFASFILGIMNSIDINRSQRLNVKEKTIWAIVSLIPILYFLILVTIVATMNKTAS